MVILGGPTGARPTPAGAPARNMAEAFQSADDALPALREDMLAHPDQGMQSQALSRDVKATLASIVGDLPALPPSPEAAYQFALNVTAAAAMLGAMDGAVSYLGGLMPLRVPDDAGQSPPAHRVGAAFERAGHDAIEGSFKEYESNGCVSLQQMSHMGKALAGAQVDEVRDNFSQMHDVDQFQQAVAGAMMTAYTVGIIDSCTYCVGNETPNP